MSKGRSTVGLLYIAAGGALAVGLGVLYNSPPSHTLLADRLSLALAPGGQVHEARLAGGTEGLLRQTAEHLSRMQGGASIGGFPGFEPPDDDEEYRRKIKDKTYDGQDVNDWVREINNFLRQIVKKNPGLTLEEILQRQGLTPGQIDGFVKALRDAHATADGMSGHGVNEATVEMLEGLMKTLGVSTW